MEKHMTDQEFSLLRNKIAVAEDYVRDLQTLHMGQTGRKYHPFERPTYLGRQEAIERAIEDLERML